MTAQYGGAKPLGRKVHTLNPNSQGALIPPPLLREQIQLRYKNIYVIFCDDKGILKYYFSEGGVLVCFVLYPLLNCPYVQAAIAVINVCKPQLNTICITAIAALG